MMRVQASQSRPLNTSASGSSPAELHVSFTEKYGRCLEILHYGSNGTVRLHQSKIPTPESKSKLVAVKVYRSHILDSSSPLATSTCSAAAIAGLHPRHPNILPIADLLHNERSELCLVMPYCAGGDMHELLSRTGALPSAEADCLVAQVLRALAFLHEHDTAHRDIRLETILLTNHGSVKLAGFGDGHIRRIWHECAVPTEPEEAPPSQRCDSAPQHSPLWSLPSLISVFLRSALPRLAGEFTSSSASFPGISLPYIPPEGFRPRSHASLRREDDPNDDNEEDHDPRPADVWAVAIVYLILITGRLPWRSARPSREDPRYVEYLHYRQTEDGYPPIEALEHVRHLGLPFLCFCFVQY
ncbi:uncharacterized protein N7459_006909 [Penicillium hispanicum]|uniref:uncharacterized protein n=1 Tax=Penicillium hispanicum TaxID=1080232 RepID=UPI00253F6793|nr:uncharacterized protein N7459_006909 [Penicillium hispanicum]KAJ5577945.1 hypothetical protein N7459_006909 [Penicillium hispanicum]